MDKQIYKIIPIEADNDTPRINSPPLSYRAVTAIPPMAPMAIPSLGLLDDPMLPSPLTHVDEADMDIDSNADKDEMTIDADENEMSIDKNNQNIPLRSKRYRPSCMPTTPCQSQSQSDGLSAPSLTALEQNMESISNPHPPTFETDKHSIESHQNINNERNTEIGGVKNPLVSESKSSEIKQNIFNPDLFLLEFDRELPSLEQEKGGKIDELFELCLEPLLKGKSVMV